MAMNINTATYDDLLLLENIGKSRANAILQERSKKKMLSIQDLKLIPDIPENVWDNLVDTGKINFEPEEGSLKFNHEMQEYVRSLQENLRDKDKQLQSFNAAIEEQGQEFKTQMTGIEAQHQKNIAEIHTQFEEKLVNMQNQFKDNMEKEKMAPSGIYGKDPTLSEISVPSKTALLKHQTIPIKEEIKENKLPTVTKNQTTEDRYVKSSIEGPLTPKMSTFDGKADWRPYFAQFCHIAKRCKWSEQQKLDNLIVCLRDKALKFYSSRPVEIKDNFQVLCKKMNDRFGRKDLPHILRRQLQEAKQGSDESLEEFADKVQELATDGYPESPDYFIQIVAVDAFLKGCAEKQAALVAMDKNPSSLNEATQYMKSAITNQRLIMGSRKTTDIKRVTFEDPAELKDSEAVIRAIYREKPQSESSKMDIRVKKNEDDIQEMKKSLSQILNILKGNDERSRSLIAFRKSSPAPSPDRKRLENSTCFACGNLGHFAASCPKRNFDRSRSPSPRKDLKGLLAPHIVCNKTSPIALLRNPTERPIMLRKYHTFGTGVEVEEILDAALEVDSIKVNRLKTEERQSIQEETIEDFYLKLLEHLRQLFKNSANNLTYALSRILDETDNCFNYMAGIDINSLPCGGCKFCRRAQEQCKTFEEDIDYVTPLAVRRVNAIPDLPVWIGQIPREEIKQCQLQDPDTSLLLTWLQENYSPSRNELQLCSPAVKHFWQCQPQLRIQDGILYYWWEDPILPKLLLVAPKALHREFLENCHSRKFSGHLGQDKTLARLKKQVVWHHMREDCLLFIKTCKICSMNKKPNIRPKAELGQYLSEYLSRVHMDLLGPLPVTKQKNKYVLMIVDQFTKWLECFPIPGQTAEIVAKAAVDGFISRFGCPLEVHTDQGKNVDGNLMWNLCELLEISKTRTTAYHPASNEQVERYNRTVFQIIRCFLNKKQCEWDVHLQQLVGAIRATENRQTGFTPNVMMLGREVFHPIDLMLGTSRDTAKDPPEYIKQLKETLYEVHELARVNLQRAQKRQKKDYDLKTNQQKYDIGDILLKINSATKVGQTPKFKQPWKGPYIVTEVKSPVLYKIQDKKTESVVHHDRLKMCYFTELPIWLKRLRNNILHDTDSNVPIENEDSEDLDDIYDISGLFTNPDPVSDSLTSEPDINLTHYLQDITLESDTLTPDQGHRPVI
ncbi:unnamed protein product [Mytilus edulis]|uniref:Uncharacterized protein n=1 Tax=Mytilus edulis TaxID=6550 RepID=A0A8S3TDL8_MYTED|nr:unnamed protein product [Mytilus edulis]